MDKIKALKLEVANGKIEEVLDQMLQDPYFQDREKVYQLSYRYSQVREAEIMRSERYENLLTEKNNIAKAILDVLYKQGVTTASGEEYSPQTSEIFHNYPLKADLTNKGLKLVNYYNDHARYLFENIVLNKRSVSFDPEIWDEIFSEDELQAQGEFVETISPDNQDVKYSVLSHLKSGIKKIWLIGNAGVGKTTTFYNIYFSLITEENFPVPILLQPQELDSKDIQIFSNTDNILESVLIIWLQNRGLLSKRNKSLQALEEYSSHPFLREILDDLIRIIKNGEAILLIDSFDELSRMSFQVEVFRKLFELSNRYLCASRPETYLSYIDDHIKIRIKSPWALPTIKKYIDVKDRLKPSWKEIIYSYVANNETARWLRNPRYLNLLIGLIQQNYQNSSLGFEEAEIKSFLSHGEYKLFHKIFEASFRRIQRHLKNHGITPSKIRVERTLTEIAIGQLNEGNYTLSDTEKSQNMPYWEAILSESSLIRRKVKTGDNKGELISLLNHNLVDFFTCDNIVDQLLDDHLHPRDITFNQLWTQNLLKYISQNLWERYPDPSHDSSYQEAIHIIWDKLRKCSLDKLSPSQPFRKRLDDTSFNVQFMAVNLLQLLIRFEIDRIWLETHHSNPRALVEFTHRTDFSDLNLADCDFRDITFINCDFSQTIFHNANFKNAKFEDCSFFRTNLISANFQGVILENCRFDFPDSSSPSPIQGLQIKGISIKNSRLQGKKEVMRVEDLLNCGAINLGSRYASKFGADFLKNQRKYLGAGLSRAEHHYMNEKILPRLKEFAASNKKVYLVDLMAGGNNNRIIELFTSIDKLRVLAIDKHTHLLEPIQAQMGENFKVINYEINGKMNLSTMVEDVFNSTKQKYLNFWKREKLKNKVDIIIGKKALHELNRNNQIEVLRDCYEALESGGRLILFTDSPFNMGESGYQRLQKLKRVVWDGKDLKFVRKQLIQKLDLEDGEDDVAIFSNLWVFLKDWANENMSEVENRYFSSISEIISWSEQIGFRLNEPPHREHYQLTAKFFNEFAFNQIDLLLSRKQARDINEHDKKLIYEYLKGSPKHRVFFDFAEKHLFKQKLSSELTSLGQKLGAKRVALPAKIRGVNPRLDNIQVPYESGATFAFSVHVIEMVKP